MSKEGPSLSEARVARSREEPIVGGLPDVEGIGAAMRLTPELGVHLRGLADQVLVKDFPGATISRAERELLATALSASNDCFYCMDSHAAHASAVLELEGAARRDGAPGHERPPTREGTHEHEHLLETIRHGSSDGFDPKMRALLHITRTVGRQARDLTAADVAAAREAGASDADVQLAVLIAAAFSMYNRMVDGFRARTPADTRAYKKRAAEIAEHGYSAPPPMGAQSNGAPPRSST